MSYCCAQLNNLGIMVYNSEMIVFIINYHDKERYSSVQVRIIHAVSVSV